MLNEIIQDNQLTKLCGQRDLSQRMAAEAASLIEKGHAMMGEARIIAREAANGSSFQLVNHANSSAYSDLFRKFDRDMSLAMFRKSVDASIWMHLIKTTGIENLMDATALKDFFQQLSTSVPEVSEDNVQATLGGLASDSELIFQRGLARVFSGLDPRFKSHDAFKIGSRMIITGCFDSDGSWNYYKEARKMISDVERVLAILDGQKPSPGALKLAIDESRGGWGPRAAVAETKYLKIRTYKNGNAHLWFVRPDLTKKANLVLADYYGAVLPDAVPEGFEPEESSALCRDLSYYFTPDPVVKSMLSHLRFRGGEHILEPSAGTGHIVRGLLDLGYTVTAVEVDKARHRELSTMGAEAICANFLDLTAHPSYDNVVMNPPFSGTHWMKHIRHAFNFLAPGGTLVSIVPATASIGTSAAHIRFRAWAKKRTDFGRDFIDLPQESFEAAGTRINTQILVLTKPVRQDLWE